MKTVWLLLGGADWGEHGIEGVYSTKFRAMAARVPLEEAEKEKWPTHPRLREGYDVQEYPVDPE